MGISNLQTFITTQLSHHIRHTKLDGMKVLVDGDGFVQWLGERVFQHQPFKQIPSARKDLVSGHHDFLEYLRPIVKKNDVVFVFDVEDVYYELKEEKKQDRKRQRALGKKHVEKVGHFHYERPPKRRWDNTGEARWFEHKNAYENTDAVSYLHKDIKERLKRDLITMGVHIHEEREEEADYELVRLHTQTPNSCILAMDTDFVVFPGVSDYRVLNDRFDWQTLKVDQWNVPEIKASIVKRWNCAQTFLSLMQLCGSDYLPYTMVKSIRDAMGRKEKTMTWFEHTMNHRACLRKRISPAQLARIKDAVNVYQRRPPPTLANGKKRSLARQLSALTIADEPRPAPVAASEEEIQRRKQILERLDKMCGNTNQ